MNAAPEATTAQKGLLGWIERTGNKLPDPVFLFLYLILGLVALSVVADLAGFSALHPVEIDEATGQPRVISATSMLAAENVRRLWVEMPTTFAHFHPLGYVLVVMLGAGVAERAGLFGVAMRASVANVSKGALTPMMAFVGMMGNLAADAAYVVLIPLAGIIYHAAGRHPVAGITACFAGVAGGFSANLLPGQLDALLFGITQAAMESVFGPWQANIAGNWYFIAGMLVVFLPVIWFVTDRIVEPRLGPWQADRAEVQLAAGGDRKQELTPAERKGLRHAGLALLAVTALWALFVFGPGTPLVDQQAPAEARLTPLYQSLVAFFFLLFLLAGWAFGRAVGTVTDHRSLVKMMSDSMGDMAYYLVLAFAAAHFVAMFGWSNLGLILAVHGADALRASGLPAPALLALIIVMTALLNLFIGSASAKWALLAPILVPMLLLLGISPEMTTAAYRVGDGATNIITPLMVYFPLVLIFCQRWDREFGLGSLAAAMLPYSIGILITGIALTIGWVVLDLPLGPGASVFVDVPAAAAAAPAAP